MQQYISGYDSDKGRQKPELVEAVKVVQVKEPSKHRVRGSISAAVEQHLQTLLDQAARNGDEYIEVVSLELAKAIGILNRMPSICEAMKKFMRGKDIVVHSTPSGKSTTERIRYFIR